MSVKKKSEDNRVEILVVEDSPTQAEQLKYILETEGYQVTVARNGEEALSLMNKRRPTLVISDILMPEMDGYQLCRQIRADKDLRSLPVILLTALSDSSDVVKALECGADNFLTKPYEGNYLLSRLRYFLINQELRRTDSIHMGLEIFFQGQKFLIDSDRMQILNLLLSTYEAAVQKNRELTKVQEELRNLNEQLEERVEQRTAALQVEIVERKRAERESQSLAKFPSENPNPVLRISREGTLLYINEAGLRQLPEWHVQVGQAVPTLLREIVFQSLDNESTKVFDLEYCGRVYSFTITPVVGAGYVNLYGLDITERKRAEEVLKETMADLKRSNKDLEQFAYIASHDLQEPLRMVASYTQLIARRYKDKLDADANEFIGFAVDGARRMQKMIDDLLSYSRVGTRRKPFESVDWTAIFNQVVTNLKLVIEETGAVITHDPLPMVRGDDIATDSAISKLDWQCHQVQKRRSASYSSSLQLTDYEKTRDEGRGTIKLQLLKLSSPNLRRAGSSP